MATLTASLAASTVFPSGDHTGVTLRGQYTGAVSTSASGVLLLAKIPVNCKDVQISFQHATAETTAVMNYGCRHGHSASASLSAFAASATAGRAHVSKVYTPSWDDAGNEKHKYVQATLATGTKAASSTMYYTITYGF